MAHNGEAYLPGRTRDPETFRKIQSTFSSSRRPRPPAMHIDTRQHEQPRIPLREPNMVRQPSKGGLRSIFTRNKPEKAVISPVVEESTPTSAFSSRSMRDAAASSLKRSLSIRRAGLVANGAPVPPVTPAKSMNKPSRMNLRSKSAKQVQTPSKPSPKSTKSSTTKTSPRPMTRCSATWDPPPLFQAYPQAIKHAQLQASTLSADAILRISNHKRNNSLRDDLAIAQLTGDGNEQTAAVKKAVKAKSRHRRQISGSLSKADWTRKIYILVTSGYLLQYAGEGSFDRLPEKMMQLGKDSVAFASDVIPGKHWVLQISQSMDADGAPTADPRSLLSRLTFRGADYRRTATSLLLILNSAEDMDSWISAVRREIEALGGKKHVSETGKAKPDDNVMELKTESSHRYLFGKNPDQFSNPTSPEKLAFGPPPWVKNKENELQVKLEEAVSALVRPPSPPIRPSTGHRSITDSTFSQEGQQLETPKDNSNRFSYVSSGQRTLIASRGSSPAISPTRGTMPTFDEVQRETAVAENRLRPEGASIGESRSSTQIPEVPSIENPAQTQSRTLRHSTYGASTYSATSRSARSRSPAAPNFSVPNSSSKRYSTAKSHVVGQISPLPPPATAHPTRPRDAMLKGTRKAPPKALHVARPLSPVKDSGSPNDVPLVFTPTDPSFEQVGQAKASIVDIPPRSPAFSSTSTKPQIFRPHRMSGASPLRSPEASQLDFQFPRRYSSMQTLRDVKDLPLVPPQVERPPVPPLSPSPRPQPVLLPGIALEEKKSSGKVNQTRPLSSQSIYRPPPSVQANTKTKIKRPISMQMHIRPSSSHSSLRWPSGGVKPVLPLSPSPPQLPERRRRSSDASKGISHVGSLSPFPLVSPRQSHLTPAPSRTLSPTEAAIPLVSPSLVRMKDGIELKPLGRRSSTPTLTAGPPPAPPPDYALPPLPPGSAGLRSPINVPSRTTSVRV